MKTIRRFIYFLLFIIILLIALPFIYKDTLIKKYVQKINNDYNIEIAYKNVAISLFKNFPDATLTLKDISILTEEPFKNDTLVAAKSVFLNVNVKDIFKKDIEKIKIKELTFNTAKLNLIVNKKGIANYIITKKENTQITNKTTTNKDYTFELNQYNLKNTDINYTDYKNNTFFNLKSVNHSGKGDFTKNETDLITKTKAKSMSLKLGDITYINKVNVVLDAVLGIDFKENKYILKQNTAKINDLNLTFNGFVKVNKKNIETNLSFHSPKANFKSVLSLIPSAYSNSFNGVKATGIANISGVIIGKNSATEIPKYNIKIKTENASFKYPNLPKAVKNITFDGAIVNNSVKNNAFLEINNLKFTIDQDTFEASGKITNLTSNPTYDTKVKGTLNLENLTQAYPLKFANNMTGVLTADFTTQTDQNAILTNNFNEIKTNGTASLKDFSYKGKDVANVVYVKNANVNFKTNTINLTDFNAKTGSSDIQATGTLDNLYAFIFNENEKLKGTFNVNANNFIISDFLVDQTNNKENTSTQNTTAIESLKIPQFLDVVTNVKAKKVVYDNLVLNNVSGKMQLKDQKATLTNVKANMLQGDVGFKGIVDTKPTPVVFDLDLLVNDFDIANSFSKMETFQKIIPIAKAINGKYDTTFKIKGFLNDDFSLNTNSINGNALAQLLVNDINNNAVPLLKTLAGSLSFIDINQLKLDNLTTDLFFDKGRVSVKPFDIKYKDIIMHISGNHGFDKSLQYQLKMDIPAKYLGTEAVNLLSNLTNINKDTIKIPLNTMITGTVLKPIVKPNFKQAMTSLAVKIAKYQKDQLINQVTNQVNDVINNTVNDVLEDNGIIIPKDSTGIIPTPGDIINDGLNGVIDGIFGDKKKKTNNPKKKN